ncbi:hypothetical protein TL16_g11441 [Triparma laevis f. inornata]|uniref:RING-type domain-containing protein n=2 Tax=Triparma laevis TaxID=1534972 RepID=A0A9W6ZW01_9STRA|nr:hypothetical protein TrLO_g10036 [Triparma laevis f. longispina]GMH89385.1 hypothetical protein TL16_g11441 [Triparma laevis f. inornata]
MFSEEFHTPPQSPARDLPKHHFVSTTSAQCEGSKTSTFSFKLSPTTSASASALPPFAGKKKKYKKKKCATASNDNAQSRALSLGRCKMGESCKLKRCFLVHPKKKKNFIWRTGTTMKKSKKKKEPTVPEYKYYPNEITCEVCTLINKSTAKKRGGKEKEAKEAKDKEEEAAWSDEEVTEEEVKQAQEDNTCLICWEPGAEVTTMCCKVPLHTRCFAKWLSGGENQESCVQCRNPYPQPPPEPARNGGNGGRGRGGNSPEESAAMFAEILMGGLMGAPGMGQMGQMGFAVDMSRVQEVTENFLHGMRSAGGGGGGNNDEDENREEYDEDEEEESEEEDDDDGNSTDSDLPELLDPSSSEGASDELWSFLMNIPLTNPSPRFA